MPEPFAYEATDPIALDRALVDFARNGHAEPRDADSSLLINFVMQPEYCAEQTTIDTLACGKTPCKLRRGSDMGLTREAEVRSALRQVRLMLDHRFATSPRDAAQVNCVTQAVVGARPRLQVRANLKSGTAP